MGGRFLSLPLLLKRSVESIYHLTEELQAGNQVGKALSAVCVVSHVLQIIFSAICLNGK